MSAILQAPGPYRVRHRQVLDGVESIVSLLLLRILMVQHDARQPVVIRDTRPKYPRPVAAAHAHAPEAGLQGFKPGQEALGALPGIPQVHALLVHALPGIPQVHELSAHPGGLAGGMHQLAVHALPGAVARAPAATDPAGDAVEPAA